MASGPEKALTLRNMLFPPYPPAPPIPFLYFHSRFLSLAAPTKSNTHLQSVSKGSHLSCGRRTTVGPLLVLWAPDYNTRLHAVHIKAVSARPQEIMLATADVDLWHYSCFQLFKRDILDSQLNLSQTRITALHQIFYLRILFLWYCWRTDRTWYSVYHHGMILENFTLLDATLQPALYFIAHSATMPQQLMNLLLLFIIIIHK